MTSVELLADKPGETNNPPTVRRLQLDVLRGMAILLVLVYHPVAKIGPGDYWLPVALLLHRIGWTGVELFFVLSGFLVGGLLLDEIAVSGRIDVRRFLLRRAFKIWPAYYAYLMVVFIILLRIGLPPRVMLPFLFHAQNYLGRLDLIAQHTWSLAVEEHFYLALPILLVLLPGLRRPPVALVAFAALAVSCGAARWQAGLLRPWSLTHLRIDSLAFGVLLAGIARRSPEAFVRLGRRPWLSMPAGALFVWWASAPDFGPPAVVAACAPAMLYLGYGLILVAVLNIPDRHFQVAPLRALGFVGLYSYSIYIWHLDTAYRLVSPLAATGASWGAVMAVYIAVAIAIGVLAGRTIERPALLLRDHLIPPRVKGSQSPGLRGVCGNPSVAC